MPWRQQLRRGKKQAFIYALIGLVVFAFTIILVSNRYYISCISSQKARNTFIQSKLKLLATPIEEVKQLQQTRLTLLGRVKLIQKLQRNRSMVVKVFDELARGLAKGVVYTSINFIDQNLKIKGIAESNQGISSQLRNFNQSDWFTDLNVTAITTYPRYGLRAGQFEFSLTPTTPLRHTETKRR